jgi:undecaprenyl phosphate N,N'-diacetylbacillosamine 1-phosphate transferase
LIGMGSPIIFSQERIGRGEKPFRFYKYRSMTNARDADGNLLDETKRLTRFGSFLRSTSLDELPELFLILTGKMSIIGPRPLPTYYMPYYREEERVRHTVRGGLIPADTISGKPIITWDEQLKWDAYYAKHCSFLLDIKIFIVTFKVLFLRAKEDYGSADRPHFNEERSGVTQ